MALKDPRIMCRLAWGSRSRAWFGEAQGFRFRGEFAKLPHIAHHQSQPSRTYAEFLECIR